MLDKLKRVARLTSEYRRKGKNARRQELKRLANATLKLAHLRVERAGWGPRGFMDTLARLQRGGIEMQQIVDVGAASGTWAIECAEIFPAAKIFMVEPLAKRQAKLAALAQSKPNLSVFMGGLGRQRGRLPIHQNADQSSFLASAEYGAGGTTDIEIHRLDDLVAEGVLAPPDLLKADVQGFELEVLGGAEKTLERCPLVLLEVSFRRIYDGAPLAHEVIAYMGARGYRILDICTYVQRAHDDELAQSDILFAKDTPQFFAYEGWR